MPFLHGKTIKGWGVFKDAPWHFVGKYADRAQAEAKAHEMGSEYQVRLGENQEGTDNFIFSES